MNTSLQGSENLRNQSGQVNINANKIVFGITPKWNTIKGYCRHEEELLIFSDISLKKHCRQHHAYKYTCTHTYTQIQGRTKRQKIHNKILMKNIDKSYFLVVKFRSCFLSFICDLFVIPLHWRSAMYVVRL